MKSLFAGVFIKLIDTKSFLAISPYFLHFFSFHEKTSEKK